MKISQISIPKTPHFLRKICSLDPNFGNPCGTHRGGSTYGPNRHRPPPPLLTDKSCKFSLFQVILGLFLDYINHPAPLLDLGPPFYKSWIRPWAHTHQKKVECSPWWKGHSSLQCIYMHDQRVSKYSLIRIHPFKGRGKNTPTNRNLAQFCLQILPINRIFYENSLLVDWMWESENWPLFFKIWYFFNPNHESQDSHPVSTTFVLRFLR